MEKITIEYKLKEELGGVYNHALADFIYKSQYEVSNDVDIDNIIETLGSYYNNLLDSSDELEEITQEEIIDLMKERKLTIEKVIDAILEANGFIGVGLISLRDHVYNYITQKIK